MYEDSIRWKNENIYKQAKLSRDFRKLLWMSTHPNILIESISDERTSDSGVPARATYRVDATVVGDSPDEKQYWPQRRSHSQSSFKKTSGS